MRARTLYFGVALILCFLAVFAGGPQPVAEASPCSLNYCQTMQASCLAGCHCAIFTCDPGRCESECICPIICLD